MPQLDEYLRQLAPSMTQWRRDFHLHAESGWLEFRTASKVADILDGLGYQLALGRDVIDADSRMGLPDEETLARAFERAREQGAPERWLRAFEGGFAGVVATLDTGRPGPTLAFRVDMDALDLNEQHDDSHRPHRDHFASCNAGMMHACGHDGHTAIGLGLAHVLKQYAAQLNGVIKLIFQPAEEGTRGARAMVAAGVVDDVDYFTAIHIGTGVPIFFFFVVSLAYGIATGKIRRQADLPQLMIEPMKEMAGFIVMVFPLAQFVAMFNWSNMGKFMAVGLTDLLESSGMNGVPAFVGLALLSAFLCMFIASGSAIWSILAPIFVPMFMLLGFHPAFAQILFRIADSSVLPLAPVSPFVPLFLGFLQRYRPDARLGTYYSLVLPYPLIFLAVWLLLLVGWYLVGLPIGPGIYPRLS